METLIKIIEDSIVLMENGEDVNFIAENLEELYDTNKFNIDLLISFYEGKTKFTEEEYFEIIDFLDFLDSKRLNECIILAKHLRPNFYKNREYRELIRYCKEFEIEQTLFLSFCRYDIIDRVKKYITPKNKNLGYNFSLTMN